MCPSITKFISNLNFLFLRHERPNDPDDPLSEQNIRDRYYGNNDPVADKLMKRAKEMPKPIWGITLIRCVIIFQKTFSMTILAVGISTKLCNFETHETNIFIYETS